VLLPLGSAADISLFQLPAQTAVSFDFAWWCLRVKKSDQLQPIGYD